MVVIDCCLAPGAKVGDDGNEGGFISWMKGKEEKVSKRISKSSKSKKETKNKKSKNKSMKDWTKDFDSRDEQDDNCFHESDHKEERRARKKTSKKKNKKKKERKIKKTDASCRSERLPKKEESNIFREHDAMSIKSDPSPASLPTSLLAESFYSDDSLGYEDVTFEVDYATSTPLFESLELNDWGNVLFFLRSGKFFSSNGLLVGDSHDSPETQARTWVHSRDEQGNVMWRQLPLHAAICLSAPLIIVQRLLHLFPESVGLSDSFGNLPVNLAMKLHGRDSCTFQAVQLKGEQLLGFSRPSRELLSPTERRIGATAPVQRFVEPLCEVEEETDDDGDSDDDNADYDYEAELQYDENDGDAQDRDQDQERVYPIYGQETSVQYADDLPVLSESTSETKSLTLSLPHRSWSRPTTPIIDVRDLESDYGESSDQSEGSSFEGEENEENQDDFEEDGGDADDEFYDDEGGQTELYNIYARKPSHSQSSSMPFDADEVALVNKDTFELYYY